MSIRQTTKYLHELVSSLDDKEISQLVEGGISSSHLRDMGEILIDLANSVDYYRDIPFYEGGPILRRVK